MRVLPLAAALACSLLYAETALAQEPDPQGPAPGALPPLPPAQPAAPAPAPGDASPTSPASPAATPNVPAPAPVLSTDPARGGPERDAVAEAPKATDGARTEGVRLGLELGAARTTSSDTSDALNSGTPTLLPIGADLSFRTSARSLVGFHGHAALASRDDCSSVSRCTARSYALRAHYEYALGRGPSFVPWIRYGFGWEMIYKGGLSADAGASVTRHAIDIADVRVGGDFVVARGSDGRTTRLGPYAGLTVGAMFDQKGERSAGSSGPDLDRGGGGAAHAWLSIGVRGTIDP